MPGANPVRRGDHRQARAAAQVKSTRAAGVSVLGPDRRSLAQPPGRHRPGSSQLKLKPAVLTVFDDCQRSLLQLELQSV